MPAQKLPPMFVPLGAGLETEIDDKLLPLGKVLEAENCHPSRTGEMVRRFGVAGTSAPAHPFAVANHNGALVSLSIPGPTPIAVTPAMGSPWSSAFNGDRRGPLAPALTPVSGSALAGDVAYGGGYFWVIYQDASAISPITLLRWAVLDATTGHVAASGSLAPSGGATAFNAWTVVFAGTVGVFVYLANNTTTNFLRVDPTASFATATASASAGTTGNFYLSNLLDAMAFGTTVGVVTSTGGTGGNGVGIDYDTVGNTATTWALQDASSSAVAIAGGIQWARDFGASGKRAIFTANGTQGLRAQWNVPGTGATRVAGNTYTLDAGATTAGLFIAGHTTGSDATGQLSVVYGLSISTGINIASRVSGTINTNAYVVGLRLASKTWALNGDYYMAVRLDSATDGTHYVLRVPVTAAVPTVLAPLAQFAVRTSTAVGLGGFTPPGLSSVATPTANSFTMAITYQPRLEVGTFATSKDRLGVELATITHGTTPNATFGVPREALGSLLVPHGFLGAFDGQTYCEAGFAYNAQQPISGTPSAGGGLTASSNYWYVITYARMDATGRVWRSNGSIPFEVATGAGNGTVTLATPYLHLAGFTGGLVEIWRGAAGISNLFQKVGEQPNSITGNTFNFVDTMSDATLSGNEFLYTNGGFLGNDTPPVFTSIAIADDRVWGISADDPQVLWYSKSLALGLGLGWSEQNTLDVRDQHGAMTGLGVVNDRAVVFKRDSVYVVPGDPPNDLGQGGTFSKQMVGEGIGCANTQSICEYKDGVAFQSTSFRAGFWALDRGATLQYVGREAQRYGALVISGSLFFPELLQLRFYATTGRTIVLDLPTGIWSTYTTALGSIHGAVCWRRPGTIQAPVYFLNGSSLCFVEDLANPVWTDLGDIYTMKLTSPWLQINGIRGYERFYRLQAVGEAMGAATLTAALYSNFNDASAITSASEAFTSGTLDSELRYSAKLAAIKVIFTDNAPANAGFSISGFAMVIAAKGGLRKAADAVRMT